MDNVDIDSLSYEQLLKYQNELEEDIAGLSASEQALKTLANSGYGAIGNATFRYYREEIAEAITLTGQFAIRFIGAQIDALLNKETEIEDNPFTIYQDTDSCYVCFDPWINKHGFNATKTKDEIITILDEYMSSVVEPYIANQYQYLSDYIGAPKNYMIMKREVIADAAIFRGKKNYIIQVWDNEHVRYTTPDLKMMGIETAKTSSPMIIRKKLEECLKIVINKDDRTVHELKDVVNEFKKEFKIVDVQSIASPRGVKDIEKWLSPQNTPMKGCPIHVRASINYNNLILNDPILSKKYPLIKSGDKIKFIKLKLPNPVQDKVVGWPDELPYEFELLNYVDRDAQFQFAFINPLKTFTNLIDWNITSKCDLTDLFQDEEEDHTYTEEVVKVTMKSLKSIAKKKMTLDDFF